MGRARNAAARRRLLCRHPASREPPRRRTRLGRWGGRRGGSNLVGRSERHDTSDGHACTVHGHCRALGGQRRGQSKAVLAREARGRGGHGARAAGGRPPRRSRAVTSGRPSYTRGCELLYRITGHGAGQSRAGPGRPRHSVARTRTCIAGGYSTQAACRSAPAPHAPLFWFCCVCNCGAQVGSVGSGQSCCSREWQTNRRWWPAGRTSS